MSNEDAATLQNIINAGKKEFLEKGFKTASLRSIVKEAGVTTGAFYGYFSSKEALYTSIVEPHAAAIMSRFMKAQLAFADLPDEEQPEHMGVESKDCIDWIIDYIYEHFDEVKILICCNDGTSYQNFVDRMVEVEVNATFSYIDTLKKLGKKVNEVDADLAHMIVSGMFNGMFEVLYHNMPKERAKMFATQLREFDTAGWKKIMGQ
ncbi:MAG: TetR/AcrR family transcriptional regulator [Acetobacter sp.]|nr:TetR/AcrR family transcriptional regulator [Bacteroides sp.]MCM1340133.1 TetR/AcrR family transcriptional regulator [Acetobacter sp.]MCM1432715.1 TetR/AcrR family transcriptional regulator [Clostridiales bacterium]